MTNKTPKPNGKVATAKRQSFSRTSTHASCGKKRAALKARIRSLEARVENLEIAFGKTFSLGVDVVGQGKRI